MKDLWLYHTVDRNKIGTYSLGDVGESSLWAYAGAEMNFGPVMVNPGVRVDWFKMDYIDKTAQEYTNPHNSQATVSPKLNITWDATRNFRLLLKAGKGLENMLIVTFTRAAAADIKVKLVEKLKDLRKRIPRRRKPRSRLCPCPI